MSAITTHVLDTMRGRPASGLPVRLEAHHQGAWRQLGHGATDADGRVRTLLPDTAPLGAGAYRLVFDTASYFAPLGIRTFYPRVTIEFAVEAGEAHYHVPLLLSPFAYTTYRGS